MSATLMPLVPRAVRRLGCRLCIVATHALRMHLPAAAPRWLRPSAFSTSTASTTMDAQVLVKQGRDFVLQLEKLRMPIPGKGEVLIKTKACGVCLSDLHVMHGDVKLPPPPVVMGHEMSGEVVECGVDVPHLSPFHLQPGTRVVVPFIIPCGACHFCNKGKEDLCENFVKFNRRKGVMYDGKTRLFRQDGSPVGMYSMGGHATHCVVPASSVFPLPSNVPYADASIVGCSVFTAYGAVKHAADVKAGESVAVLGSGGVGAAVIQIARAFGASQVIAIDIDDDKLQQMKQIGATHVINNRTTSDLQAELQSLTGGYGVDVCIEALGRPQTFHQATNAVTSGGRAVAIGLASAGIMGEVEMNSLVRRQVRVIGSYGARARADMPVILKMLEKGQVNISKNIGRRYKGLEQTTQAYLDLRAGKVTGRAIVEMF